MRRILTALSLLACLSACAHAPLKAPDPAKRAATMSVLRQAIETGRASAAQDPTLTPRLEEASLAWLLYRGPAPYAGARRLLDLKERQPAHPLVPVFFDNPDGPALASLQQDETFRGGLFFNSYEPALFRPFYRLALLAYLRDPRMDDQAFGKLMEPVELGLKLTPRFAGVYPNALGEETRKALTDYIKDNPKGSASERMQMLLAWDRRNGAWGSGRRVEEETLSRLAETTQDELLKLEIRDGLTAPLAKPEKAFWYSLAIPGLGQIAYGDVQGGLLLGGLTLSAWIWAGSRLAAAQNASDTTTRNAAYGDAAFGGALGVMGHVFTAMNASEQARMINIVIEWDTLAKDRLQAGSDKADDKTKQGDEGR